MRAPLFVCVALSLPACGSPSEDGTIDTTYDPCTAHIALVSPSTEQITETDAALTLWNERAFLTLGRATTPHARTIPVQFDDAAAAFHGVYDDEHGVVFINRDLTGHALAITIAHELGHAFGLRHVKASVRKSLMNPSNIEVEPTAEDAEQLQAIWGTCAP